MKKLVSLLFALALLFGSTAIAQTLSVGNGSGTVQTYSCGAGALNAGAFCNESGSSAPTNNCTIGAIVVLLGNGLMYTCTTSNTWTQLAGGGSYTASTNLTLTGSAFSLTTPLVGPIIVGTGGAATGCTLANSALCSAESTSSGALCLGGTSTSNCIEYGIHHVGTVWLDQGGHSVDIGDGSNGIMRLACTTTCTIWSSNDAVSANVPFSIAGFGGAALTTATINSALTVHDGPVQAESVAAGTATYVPPFYLANGTATASTMHCVQGTVTAVGASTVVTLTAPAAFANTNYWAGVEDFTTLTAAVLTAQATGSFTFTSTNAQVYTYLACGA